MIKQISFDEIFIVWQNYLWPDRDSAIEKNSAMCCLGGYDLKNMETEPTFIGFYINDELAGVNSGHMCCDMGYRSRGLFVFEKFRGKKIGTLLLKETITQAQREHATYCWSYPRKTSWNSYAKAGFSLISDWEISETSDANAYCRINLC